MTKSVFVRTLASVDPNQKLFVVPLSLFPDRKEHPLTDEQIICLNKQFPHGVHFYCTCRERERERERERDPLTQHFS